MVGVIRGALTIIRLAMPWIWRAAVFTATTMLLAAVGILQGFPSVTGRIAEDISEQAYLIGFPSPQLPLLYWTVRILAALAIAFGWVCLAYFTIFVVVVLLY